MTSFFDPTKPPPLVWNTSTSGSKTLSNTAIPPPPKLTPLDQLPKVEDAAGLEAKKLDAAKAGLSQFIWLPTVGAPTQ